MSMHRPHPINGEWLDKEYDDPPDAVLYDDCERCADQARRPWAGLDARNFARLWNLMVLTEKGPPEQGGYRTGAERDAGDWCYGAAVMIERTHPVIDPWQWPWRSRVGGFALHDVLQAGMEAAAAVTGDTILGGLEPEAP